MRSSKKNDRDISRAHCTRLKPKGRPVGCSIINPGTTKLSKWRPLLFNVRVSVELRGDTHDIQRPTYVIMVAADVLVPDRHQAISSNHQTDSTAIILSVTWMIVYHSIHTLKRKFHHFDDILSVAALEVVKTTKISFSVSHCIRYVTHNLKQVWDREHPRFLCRLRPANERRRYYVTTSLIGSAQTWKQPCMSYASSCAVVLTPSQTPHSSPRRGEIWVVFYELNLQFMFCFKPSGPWFNMKISSYQYRKSHCGDKTIWRLSYLHNGISILIKWHHYIESGPWCLR